MSHSATPWTVAYQTPLSPTISKSLFKFMPIESVMLSNHLFFCPLLLLPSTFASIRVFSSEHPVFSSSSHQVAKVSSSVLPMNIQDLFPLGLTDFISLQSKGLSRVFSSTTIWKHPFFGNQSFLGSSSHICTWQLENSKLWLYRPLLAKWCFCF